jgi:acyl dehydratase
MATTRMLENLISINSERMPEPMNEGLYYEDFDLGKTYLTHRRTITETDHVNFSTQFGFFEPLFMDREYVSKKTEYQQPIVPGALTFSMAEGLTILTGILHDTGMAFLGVELEVLKPVLIGDTIQVEIKVAARRGDQQTRSGDRHLRAPGDQPAQRTSNAVSDQTNDTKANSTDPYCLKNTPLTTDGSQHLGHLPPAPDLKEPDIFGRFF